ncbi:MAG: rRNA maturation RNase YbeY [Gemmatimonadetes bacterium]|nr:rRNA maturation RNase YbeY [Gemmatimonadota bacterium]
MPPIVCLHLLNPLPEAGDSPRPRDFARALAAAGAEAGEVNLVLTTAEELQRLNRTFRRRDRSTDVLAFDYRETASEGALWGDVYVSAEAVLEQARERGIPPREELARLFLHGCLHLLGHRDHAAQERKRMLAVQEALLPGILAAHPKPPSRGPRRR